MCIVNVSHVGEVLLTETVITVFKLFLPAFKHNKHLAAKNTCDGPCPLSGTLLDFVTRKVSDRLPALKPVSNRTTIENAIKGRTLAQVEMIGRYLQEEFSSPYSGMSC